MKKMVKINIHSNKIEGTFYIPEKSVNKYLVMLLKDHLKTMTNGSFLHVNFEKQ